MVNPEASGISPSVSWFAEKITVNENGSAHKVIFRSYPLFSKWHCFPWQIRNCYLGFMSSNNCYQSSNNWFKKERKCYNMTLSHLLMKHFSVGQKSYWKRYYAIKYIGKFVTYNSWILSVCNDLKWSHCNKMQLCFSGM